jgi:hypothetical protein
MVLGHWVEAAKCCKERKGVETCAECSEYRFCDIAKTINRYRVDDEENEE